MSVVCTGIALYFALQSVLWGPDARSDYYDHILVIPVMSAALFYWKRRAIFNDVEYMPSVGAPLAIFGAGICICSLAGLLPGGANIRISWTVFSILVVFAGLFVLFFGPRSFQKARFPLLFLAFMIPIPHVLLEWFIYTLQRGSADAVDILFKTIGVSYHRSGFFFYFQNVGIEVAKQCSGIRSSLALIVTGTLAGHLFLDCWWKKIVLVLSIFPITVLKNGIRIVTLTLLANYVDIRFLTKSFLHHSGGFIFYIPALVLLGIEIWLLRKWTFRNNVKA